MKNLILIRHAKSSWADWSLDDIDRPLNARGKRDAPVMAEFLTKQINSIDAIVSSPAKRARKTALHFAKAYGLEKDDIQIVDGIYHASPNQILENIFSFQSDWSTVLLFGHNPGFTYFADEYADQSIDNVPTCGIVHIQTEIENWQDLDPTKARVANFYYPKMFT